MGEERKEQHQYTVSVPCQTVLTIEKLKLETGANNTGEVLGDALTLYAEVVERVKSGRVLTAMDESTGKYVEITSPSLERVKSQKTKKAQ
ncbi:MAG: hypothetical protein A3I89_03180 [Candidatus Harrisonbacteria bacterium RIFCSPLOWO2_02_FULL_41_11]|uniref:Uncharacterized protein n=1 Tax=Candidatus Harrisonbacteria bacterium RIFCSPHIGHO2_02_FULL_42_16 TaxID=1798404 RepID=A0A1G1ZJ07_9BACT|nr:MAG: hypothetical protein A3B92_02670 [Candidatus Harrisonbacteria bacterium RIFCSPHIGHO2_02_FULL_42_16]OGY66241.1 MAG: hypothetical protein A3I89_03180 [Candidatus Harrisonbacteria bacterium RIFCSPLOWO2_02_FULL_41_11]